MALLHELDKRGLSVLVLRDELSGLFGAMNAYRSGKGADEQQLLELFDGHAFTSLRVTAGDRSYERCQVSIYGAIQPGVLRELIKGAIRQASGPVFCSLLCRRTRCRCPRSSATKGLRR